MTPKCPGCKTSFIGVSTRRQDTSDGTTVLLVCCPNCFTVLGVVAA